jgi:hypothetical protein
MKRSLCRTGIVLLLSVFAVVGKTDAQSPAPDIKLDFLLVEAEHSKDSNSTTTKISIAGRELEYLWHYAGYEPDPKFKRDVKASATLTDAHITALLKLLTDKNLNVDMKDISPITEVGHSLTAKLTTIQSGKTVTIEIAGMSSIWGDQKIRMQIISKEKVEALQALVSFVKDNILMME